MNISRVVYIVSILGASTALIFISNATSAEPPAGTASALAVLREAIINAKTCKETSDAFNRLFEHASDDKLVLLKADSNPGIALYAAHRMRESADPNLIAGSHPERFLGFLEGRTGVTCPPGWASTLVWKHSDGDEFFPAVLKTYGPLGIATMMDGEEVGYPKGEQQFPSLHHPLIEVHKQELDGLRTECPKKIEIDDSHLVVDKKRIPLDNTFLGALRARKQKSGFHRRFLNAIIHSDRVFVALWTFPPREYPLFCLDAKTGKVIWESDVWGLGHWQGIRNYMGDFFVATELTANDGTVSVFGVFNSIQYAECFDRLTGKSEWRFNPRLWVDK